MIKGNIEELKDLDKKSEEEFLYHEFQFYNILYYNLLIKINIIHKKYSIHTTLSKSERYNLAVLKKLEYNEMIKDFKNKFNVFLNQDNEYSKKIKDIINKTTKNINYREYNSKIYYIKNN